MRWLILAALLLPSLAWADSLLLVNGRTYVGRILEEKPGEVTISSSGAAWTFKRDRIAAVTRDAVEADREELEARDRLQEAAVEHERRLQREADRKRAFAEGNARSRTQQLPPPNIAVEPVRRPEPCSCATVVQRPQPRIDYRWFN